MGGTVYSLSGRSMGRSILACLLCVVSTVSAWMMICLILGLQVDRWDLVAWGGLAILPCLLFVLYLCGSMLRGTISFSFTQCLCICGTSLLVYVLILLVEGGITLSVVGIARVFDFTLTNSSWLILAPGIILFAYAVPALLEESGKYIIVRIHGCGKECGPYQVVIISMVGALILSSVENAQYMLTTFYQHTTSQQCCVDWVTMAITMTLRDLCSVTLHVCTGALIGASYYRWRDELFMSLWIKWIRTMAMPVFLHGTYDGVILFLAVEAKRSGTELTWLLVVPALIVLFAVLLALRQMKKAYRLQKVLQARAMEVELEMV